MKVLNGLRTAAWTGTLAWAYLSAFLLVGGLLGAVVGKPIVTLIVWVWNHTWPN